MLHFASDAYYFPKPNYAVTRPQNASILEEKMSDNPITSTYREPDRENELVIVAIDGFIQKPLAAQDLPLILQQFLAEKQMTQAN